MNERNSASTTREARTRSPILSKKNPSGSSLASWSILGVCMERMLSRVESTVKERSLLERFHVVELDGGPIAREKARQIRSLVRKAVRRPGTTRTEPRMGL